MRLAILIGLLGVDLALLAPWASLGAEGVGEVAATAGVLLVVALLLGLTVIPYRRPHESDPRSGRSELLVALLVAVLTLVQWSLVRTESETQAHLAVMVLLVFGPSCLWGILLGKRALFPAYTALIAAESIDGWIGVSCGREVCADGTVTFLLFITVALATLLGVEVRRVGNSHFRRRRLDT